MYDDLAQAAYGQLFVPGWGNPTLPNPRTKKRSDKQLFKSSSSPLRFATKIRELLQLLLSSCRRLQAPAKTHSPLAIHRTSLSSILNLTNSILLLEFFCLSCLSPHLNIFYSVPQYTISLVSWVSPPMPMQTRSCELVDCTSTAPVDMSA